MSPRALANLANVAFLRQSGPVFGCIGTDVLQVGIDLAALREIYKIALLNFQDMGFELLLRSHTCR